MKTRIITGTIIGLVIIAFFALRFVSPYFFDIFVAVVTVFGAGEVSKVFNRCGKYNNMTLQTIFPVAIFLTIILGTFFELSFLLILLIELSLFILFVAVCFIWSMADKKSVEKEKASGQTFSNYVLNKTLLTSALYLYPTIILNFMYFINHFNNLGVTEHLASNNGLFLLVIMFVTTVMTDVCAYFVGSAIKGKKLCPYISPNKTISGAIGGLVGSVLGAIIVYFIFANIPAFNDLFIATNFELWIVLIYSVVASVFSQAGDIFASWLKRTARTKDYSTIFPGHGGFMDRCDGLCFNAVFTFIFFALLF